MMSLTSKLTLTSAGVFCAALVSSLVVSGHASATTPREITLATPSQGLTFCQSGMMKAGDAYISGGPGLVQEPPTSCKQAVIKHTKISEALEVNGKKVKECKLLSATAALALCNEGGVGTYNIDYIRGKVGYTISGPGYGCTLGFSTSTIGTALCK